MIWATAVLAAANSEPYVALGVELKKWRTAVTDFPVVRS